MYRRSGRYYLVEKGYRPLFHLLLYSDAPCNAVRIGK
jgi:hypothetical protein